MSKQRNQIGIVNKQKSEGKQGSGTRGYEEHPSGELRRQGASGGVGLWKEDKKELKTKPLKTKPLKEKRTTTKRSAAHTRIDGKTQTQKVAAKGRYRGRGVVDKRP